jgi:hypothetical protein
MAIASQFTFDYGVTLGRLPTGRLGGIAAVHPLRTGYPGLLGREPALQIGDGAIQMEARQQDRPRWWMSGSRRSVLAAARRAGFPVGGAWEAFVREGDELVIAHEMSCRSSLVLRRGGTSILGAGGAGTLNAFVGPEGLEGLALAPGERGALLLVTVGGEARVLWVGDRVEAGPLAIQLREWDANAFMPSPVP